MSIPTTSRPCAASARATWSAAASHPASSEKNSTTLAGCGVSRSRWSAPKRPYWAVSSGSGAAAATAWTSGTHAARRDVGQAAPAPQTAAVVAPVPAGGGLALGGGLVPGGGGLLPGGGGGWWPFFFVASSALSPGPGLAAGSAACSPAVCASASLASWWVIATTTARGLLPR